MNDLLDVALPPAKSALARRLFLAGHRPEPADFAARGVGLNPDERAVFAAWLERAARLRVVARRPARDGSVKLAIALADGELVETVAMPSGAVCVSTQIGCAVGCGFCASGRDGLRRNLAPSEILVQVAYARRELRIDRVVFMGMGEPTHNLDAVSVAVERLVADAKIGPRRQTLSTVGSRRALARLAAAAVKPCLALSLHSADEQVRRELLPRAPREPLPALVAAADQYGRASGTPVQFEYVLLAGVNDSDADVDALCRLLRGARGFVNFLVLNPVAGSRHSAPPRERIVDIVRAVKRRDILATIRDSSGADAEAACGQLRRHLHAAPA